MEFDIPTPPGFDYKRTVMSHGWSSLSPFELDEASLTLVRVLDPGDDGPPLTANIDGGGRSLKVKVPGRTGKRALAHVVRDVRHIFRLDDDLGEFYARVSEDSDFAWVARDGAGRLLRSPTVYEDLVKSICTTNCTWR